MLWRKWMILPMRFRPSTALRLESKWLPNAPSRLSIPSRDHQLFQVLLNGQHRIRGFSNPDIRDKLQDSPFLKPIPEPNRQSAKVSRLLHRCHAHGLIAKVPHSRRWRVTRMGRLAMAASIQLREIQFPAAYMKVAS